MGCYTMQYPAVVLQKKSEQQDSKQLFRYADIVPDEKHWFPSKDTCLQSLIGESIPYMGKAEQQFQLLYSAC